MYLTASLIKTTYCTKVLLIIHQLCVRLASLNESALDSLFNPKARLFPPCLLLGLLYGLFGGLPYLPLIGLLVGERNSAEFLDGLLDGMSLIVLLNGLDLVLQLLDVGCITLDELLRIFTFSGSVISFI